MQWVKLHTTLHRHIAFRRISPTAKLVFYVCLELAGDLEQEGALYVRGAGPMTLSEISEEVGVKSPFVLKALDDLIGIGFMSIREPDKAYVIDKFDEKTQPKDPNGATRVRKHRARKAIESNGFETASNAVTSSVTNRNSNAIEEEEEVEVEGEVPRCCAGPNPYRDLSPSLKAETIVDALMATFANAKSVAAQNNARQKWLPWLRDMRDQGFSATEIWAACCTAHADAHHAPLNSSAGIFAALRRLRPPSWRPALAVVNGPSRYGSLDNRPDLD